ncbi:hypothetical protein OOU_Y34scaffold00295g19 [Pyricularia oryzae Y34]|uniref:Uncharacterized protein n=2 Tax=Pyricularia oryzae TaxID=318829 RepID=A0AA97P361_PYRO3|nr:hypothetical protein OOU_Y34scaffold00295g19 [Pyricularia oryzae Y34]KAI6266424.1 hypothetical protein MCOR26_010195 [Pyricularia oryzae]
MNFSAFVGPDSGLGLETEKERMLFRERQQRGTIGEPQKFIGKQVPIYSARIPTACLAVFKDGRPRVIRAEWSATRVHAVMHLSSTKTQPVPGQRLGRLPSVKGICDMQSILRSSHGCRNRLPCSRMCSSGSQVVGAP